MSKLVLASGLVLALLLVTGRSSQAQSPEDQLGNWLIYNGTLRFSDRWSVFTEGQLRLWEVASNVNEVFLRVAGQYNFNPDALVAFGYMRADSWPFEDGDRERIEDRLYEQFTLGQNWSRTRFEHRYRLEQRWLSESGTNHYTGRVRYRLQVTSPLNRPRMEQGAWFINVYNEFFITIDDLWAFDQNRLYGAGGYQFTALSNLQLGMLWQARSSADFFRLQIFYTHNFDFRGGGGD